jgi:glutathione S-transferase
MAAPPELKDVHPLGKSPVLEDELNGRPILLIETGAIFAYLVRKADGRLGEPATPEGGILFRQYMHYAEGSVMPVLFAILLASRIPFLGRLAVARLRPMLDVHLDFIEQELRARPWFAGDDFTAADIMMSFPLEAVRSRGGGLGSGRTAITRWLNVIRERPAYRRALARGGPYTFAGHNK